MLGLRAFIQRERRRREKLTAEVKAQMRQVGLTMAGKKKVTRLGGRIVQVQEVNLESGNLETVYPTAAAEGVALGDRQSKLDKPHLATINGLPDPKVMRAIWDEYSPETAQHIATHLPEAYAACDDPATRWGPTLIAPFVSLKRETVSRYMSAWRKAKLTELNGIPLSKE
jgi:hypothetical protein